MRKLFIVMSVLLASSNLSGQDSLQTRLLREVVVSGNRSEQSIIDVPRSVTVIEREALEKSIYNSLGELLTGQDGMYVVGAGQTPGANQSLFLRGTNSNQIAVLIDGRRITDPSTPNSVVDLSELSLSNVDRIEIIRGPHSTLYGGSALGGTINIITKKNRTPGFHGNAGIQSGTFGDESFSVSENLDLNYTLKNGFYLNGSLIDQRVKGLNATQDTIRTPGVFKTADRDNFSKTDAYIKAGLRTERWDASVFYKGTDQHADIDAGAYQDDENDYIDFERSLVSYTISTRMNSQWNISALGSWSTSSRLNENDSSVVNFDGEYDGAYFKGQYTGRLSTNELQANFSTQKVNGVLGLGYFSDDMDFTTYYFSNAFGPYEWIVNYDSLETSSKTNYAFGQLQWNNEKFNLSAGVRFSHHSIFGGFWTAVLNPSYRVSSDLVLYGSLSSGYNAPSLYQLFDPTQDFGAYRTRGNRNLNPEESLSIEIGLKKEWITGSCLTFSAYRNRVKNIIEYVYLWDKNSAVQDLNYSDYLGDTYLNFSTQLVWGAELSARAVLCKQFLVQGNISWVDAKLELDPEEISTEQTGGNHVQLYNYGTFVTEDTELHKLVRRPNLTFSGQVQYLPTSDISLSAGYRYVGSRLDSFYDSGLGPFGALGQLEVERYHLIDLNGSWKITNSVLLGLKLENVLNEPYQEILGFQTRGRSLYLKLAFTW